MSLLRHSIAAAAILIAAPAFADDARIVVPAHDIMRGDVIADSDLAYVNVSADRVRPGVVTSMNDLDGMQTRRFLHAGEPVRADDVRHPVLVQKGTTVTMSFEAPGILLTATGRAMSEGGLGETVTVLNPVSYRQVSATVTGIGQVRAAGTTTVISSSNSEQRVAQARP